MIGDKNFRNLAVKETIRYNKWFSKDWGQNSQNCGDLASRKSTIPIIWIAEMILSDKSMNGKQTNLSCWTRGILRNIRKKEWRL